MLPALDHAGDTIRALQKANVLLSYLRYYLLPHDPNYTEWGTRVVLNGTSSDTLPGGSQVILDFVDLRIIVRQPNGAEVTIPLHGHTQRSLFAAILAELRRSELAHVLTDEGDLVEQMIAALAVKKPAIAESHDEFTGTQLLRFDISQATEYATALYSIFTGIARFKASRVNGKTTPAVVFGEHFDLSTLIFAGAEANEQAAHINIGFAPYSAGIDFPYLYAYAYPMKPDYSPPSLPAPADWHTEGWTGVVLPYAAIAAKSHPEQYVEQMCDEIYSALLPLLG
jgi:hypothetical protein